ncbi:MAG: bis(5'-nucleosyl)-tetraphosphatase (symmetrical) YqeK [Thermacetogeniaceae bacterium]|jgi:predicted HD superfamily hydrolase involved in NAD metabolism|nr:bis(5'-nucleosyl)-tetraphosphatase (symmetrical) YqeK [Thermoanaerobacterales bacterium]NLN21079.1 HD domain-containing protein [Syntrophomonadaceae bacterium]
MQEYEKAIRERLSKDRMEHVLAVRDCAAELAAIHGLEQRDAELAGLLHDYARDISADQLLSMARARGLVTCSVEEKVPLLLHGPLGAQLIKEELGIDNPHLLEAVALHTLGSPAMGRLAQVIYIADLIAPGRDFPSVERLREIARNDLDRALLECFASTIGYCLQRYKLIHPRTIDAWNYYVVSK